MLNKLRHWWYWGVLNAGTWTAALYFLLICALAWVLWR